MKMAKRFLALTLVLAVALTLVACGSKDTTPTAENAADASAVNTPETDTYPERTISFIIPYAAGDGLDLSTRALLENADFPVNTLVENISGGSGTIGLQDAFGREADGYTVAILSNGPTIAQPLMNDTLSYTLEDWEILTFTTAPVLAVLGCSSTKGITNSDEMRTFLESGEKFTVGVPSMTGFGYVAAAAMRSFTPYLPSTSTMWAAI